MQTLREKINWMQKKREEENNNSRDEIEEKIRELERAKRTEREMEETIREKKEQISLLETRMASEVKKRHEAEVERVRRGKRDHTDRI